MHAQFKPAKGLKRDYKAIGFLMITEANVYQETAYNKITV